MKKRIVIVLMVLSMMIPCARAASTRTPEETVLYFLETLQAGSISRASYFCADDPQPWQPPALTRYIVYPMMADIRASETVIDEDGETAELTITLNTVDTSNIDLIERFAWAIPVTDPLADTWMDYDIIALMYDTDGVMEALNEYRKEYTLPFALRYVNDEWLIDLDATTAQWRAEQPPNVRAVSYGITEMDYAQLQYYINDIYARDPYTWGDEWHRSLTKEQVFDALGTPAWNVWLRLTADKPDEGLCRFVWEGGECAEGLEIHADYTESLQATTKRFAYYGGQYHAVLTASLPVTAGEPLNGRLSCVRRVNANTPLYFEETVEIPLEHVPYDTGCPENGVTATATAFSRVRETEYTAYAMTGAEKRCEDRLSELVLHEFVIRDRDSIWLNLPGDLDGLSILNDRYALYRVEGVINKLPGGFGVYDVTFATDTPGVYVELCRIEKGFDVIVGGILGTDALEDATRTENDFDVKILIPVEGRSEEALEEIVKHLTLYAAFSAEEIDFCYEQYGTTMRIGPRTTVTVDMSPLNGV